jgi:hypothetical protein
MLARTLQHYLALPLICLAFIYYELHSFIEVIVGVAIPNSLAFYCFVLSFMLATMSK